jgi:MFS superfamily sulfate permease-like transporter
VQLRCSYRPQRQFSAASCVDCSGLTSCTAGGTCTGDWLVAVGTQACVGVVCLSSCRLGSGLLLLLLQWDIIAGVSVGFMVVPQGMS